VDVRLPGEQVALLMNYITALKRSYFKNMFFLKRNDIALDSTILPTLTERRNVTPEIVCGRSNSACTVSTRFCGTYRLQPDEDPKQKQVLGLPQPQELLKILVCAISVY